MEGRNSGCDVASTTEVKELYLTPEERYEVYAVKASERPHLLEVYSERSTNTEIADNEETFPQPLTDGCDIPRWRAEGMTKVDSQLQAALNVGLGCNLLRRESQLPLPLSPKLNYKEDNANHHQRERQQQPRSKWEVLQEKLMYHQPVTETVERISCSKAASLLLPSSTEILIENNATATAGLSRRKVFSKWETDNYPVIIEGCTENWNLPVWDYERLVARFGDIRWRFSDIHGAVMTLETYAKYAATEGLVDDSPLAVYDSEFGDSDSPMHVLATDYITPPCFSDDLFALATEISSSTKEDAVASNTTLERTNVSSVDNSVLVGDSIISGTDSMPNNTSDSDSNISDEDSTRPPWRWILMGPPRSGTGLHIDPLWTNAWVTLLEGIKRWILIPPHLQSQLPEGSGLREPQVPSVIWFRDYYDDVIRLDGVVEILQRPGETVFVPNGWPHLVLNLERTVAVTHNYASEFGPFERMWEQVLQDEPEFSQRWYRGLCMHRPDLASRIKMPKET